MIPPEQAQEVEDIQQRCLFMRLSDYTSDHQQRISRALNKAIFQSLKSEKEDNTLLKDEIRTVTKDFMTEFTDMLKMQAHQYQDKKDHSSAALQKIKKRVTALLGDHNTLCPLTKVPCGSDTAEDPESTAHQVQELEEPTDNETDKVSHSKETLADMTTQAVKEILEEQEEEFIGASQTEGLSQEEYCMVRATSSLHTGKAAAEIMQMILGDQQHGEIATEGSPETETVSEAVSVKASCWDQVGMKIKASMIRTHIKDSVLCFMLQLMKKLNHPTSTGTKASLKQLCDAVDHVLDDVIEDTDQGCLFTRLSNSTSSQKQTISNQLSKAIYVQLKSEQEDNTNLKTEIKTGMKRVMAQFWDMLKMQAQQYQNKKENHACSV